MRTTMLLLLLLVPAVYGLAADAPQVLTGEVVRLSGVDGALTAHTPLGSYTLLGSSDVASFPLSVEGLYVFTDGNQSVRVQAQTGSTHLLRTARGASETRGLIDGDTIILQIPGIDRTVLTASASAEEVRITPAMGERWGFARTYAVDPTVPGFGTAELTFTAQGKTLYKCADYDYFAETCRGSWSFLRRIVPGEQYTITVSGTDPAFGESDLESEPDYCRFSDDAGAGDGDAAADCLTEVRTQDSGTTADLQDPEQGGGSSQIEAEFNNTLSVASVTAINVTYRYQRVANTQVADTTATIQVFDSGAWTSACVDTVSIGAWEAFTCDLAAWVTTQGETNNVRTRVLFDTGKSGQGSSEGTVYVDHSYLSVDYVYDDRYAPTYTAVSANPASPKTYNGSSSSFSADWADDVGVTEVRIEHNFTGTLQNATLTGGPTYTHARTLGAGTYSWRQIARDAVGNWNDTMPYQTYTVSQGAGAVELRLNGTRGDLTIDEDVTIDLNGTRTGGETSMTLRENGGIIATGNPIDMQRTYNAPGAYVLNLSMPATQNYTATSEEWTLTVLDKTPPGPVTGVVNQSAGESWIHWTWTNPSDPDFSHVIVEINGTFRVNTSDAFYNATGLSTGTLYQIQLRTVDASGNVNGSTQTGLGRTLVSLDVTAPALENITATGIEDSAATIQWDTDEPADSVVKYGTASGNYPDSVSDFADVISHGLTLTALVPSTTYYYVVNSTDPAGNSNQSAEFSFTTAADSTAPLYGTFTVSPDSASTFPVTANFSVNWTDNALVGEVRIEHNFTGALQNSTMSGGPQYSYVTALGAGSYRWRSIARDVVGNWNASMPYQTYTVQRATGEVNLLLNGTDGAFSIDEDTQANLTLQRIAGEGILEILEDGTVLGTGQHPYTLLRSYTNPGTHTILGRVNGTQNYTQATETHTLTVLDRTPPSVTLIEPFDGITDTDGSVVFSYSVTDNNATQSCSLYVNSVLNQTNASMGGGSSTFALTLADGQYNWTVGCADTAANSANATQRSLTVSIIPLWIPTAATHSAGGTVTALVNGSDGSTSQLNAGNAVTATAWSSSAPSNANVTGAQARCEIDAAQRGATLYFQYSTGAAFSGDLCASPQDGAGVFTCDLYAQGVDTVAEINALQVRCVTRDTNGGPSAWNTLDQMSVQPDWNLIELPDFTLTAANISVPAAKEGETVTLRANVSNTGSVGGSALVRFWDVTRAEPIGNTTVPISAGGHVTVNQSWSARIGTTLLEVQVDPLGTVTEENETNNDANAQILVSGWQFYYGSTIDSFFALGNGSRLKYNWSGEDLAGNIYVRDRDAAVTMLNVEALTRNASGAYSFGDLAGADSALGSSSFNDSVNSTFSDGSGALRETRTFTVAGLAITDVPVVSSTGAAPFVTGILWDVDDDTNGFYDGEEDLIFITAINHSSLGAYGTYDFEVRIPALLRSSVGSQDRVELYVELV